MDSFELVVDDKDAVRKLVADAGIKPLPGPFLDCLEPWGQLVSYESPIHQGAKRTTRHGG